MPRPLLWMTGLLMILAACADGDHFHRSQAVGNDPSSPVSKEKACAAEFAGRLGIKVEAVNVDPNHAERKGNTVLKVSTINGAKQAYCEVDNGGRVVGIDMIRG